MGSWSCSFEPYLLSFCFTSQDLPTMGSLLPTMGSLFPSVGSFPCCGHHLLHCVLDFLSSSAMKGSVSSAGFGAISAPNGFSLLTRGSSDAYCAMIYVHSACTIKIHIYTNTYS